jgi:hypothetical protein
MADARKPMEPDENDPLRGFVRELAYRRALLDADAMLRGEDLDKPDESSAPPPRSRKRKKASA